MLKISLRGTLLPNRRPPRTMGKTEMRGGDEPMVFDGHSDLLYDVARRRLAGERQVLDSHLGTLRRGGVEGLVLAVWASGPRETFWRETPWGDPADYRGRTEQMLALGGADLGESRWIRLVRSVRALDIRRVRGGVGGPAGGRAVCLSGSGGHGGHRDGSPGRGLVLPPGRPAGDAHLE